jgi:hypothetical protein
MVRFEPRRHIGTETDGQIESMLMPLLESPTVIVSDGYPFPLAAEIVGDEVRVRAASEEKMTYFLTVGEAPARTISNGLVIRLCRRGARSRGRKSRIVRLS